MSGTTKRNQPVSAEIGSLPKANTTRVESEDVLGADMDTAVIKSDKTRAIRVDTRKDAAPSYSRRPIRSNSLAAI